jgi:protein-L-isoaspartate O-methyltransferase
VAAAERPPVVLLAQLKPGGRLALPTGAADAQRLTGAGKEEAAGRVAAWELLAERFNRLETMP